MTNLERLDSPLAFADGFGINATSAQPKFLVFRSVATSKAFETEERTIVGRFDGKPLFGWDV